MIPEDAQAKLAAERGPTKAAEPRRLLQHGYREVRIGVGRTGTPHHVTGTRCD
jgi:hypothetical protein